MQPATITSDEIARLAALHDLNLLDTAAEAQFDDITLCVKQFFNVPICLVSLIDSDRQWFKSKQGLDVCETDRSISFCGHAIQKNHVFVVEDTLEDERFLDNPLVTSAPHIRFYAGYPLRSESGFLIGTLCIIDVKPRSFSQQHQDQLSNFGKVIEGLIRQRSTAHLLKQFTTAQTPELNLHFLSKFHKNSKFSAVFLAVTVAMFAILLEFYAETSDFRNSIYLLIGAGFACLTYLLIRLPARLGMLLKRIHALHRRGELRFKDAIEALPNGFVIFDHEQKIAAFNQQFIELYQPIADKITIGAHYKTLKAHARAIGMLAESNDIDDLTKQDPKRIVQLTDGRWIKITERPMQDGGIVGVHTDVTEIKHYEQQLVNAKHHAERANETKSKFLANISHEIRTPLNGILGLQDVLLDDPTLNNEQLFYLSTMQQSSRSLLQILNDILDISKMEAGKVTLLPAAFELTTTLLSASDLMRPIAQTKGLAFHIDIPKSLPTLFGDAGRIRQMVLNLLSNAIKFTDSGTVMLSVKYEQVTIKNAVISIEVSDTGIGIPDHQIETLLQPFVQANIGHSSGTGLGLTISNTLVQLMHGSLRLQSHSPQGTKATLTFTLPLADPIVSDDQYFEHDESHFLANKRILLADDDETNQLVVSTMLRQEKCIVDIVSNGSQAVAAASKTCYDLILMDIYMPELDGISATKIIRSRQLDYVSMPIIAFTANAMDGDKERFINAGMDGYISKPIDKNQMLKIIAQHISSFKTQN